MDLHREVLAAAERAADAAEHELHALRREREALGELVAVDVQPLGRDVQHDAALAVGHRETRLRPEEGLVLHPDLVAPADDDVGGRVGLAVLDHAPCAAGCRPRAARGAPGAIAASGSVTGSSTSYATAIASAARRAVSGWSAATIATGSPLKRTSGCGEHGLVGVLEPVRLAAGHVGVGEDGVDARHRGRGGGVERADAGARVRAAQRRAPEHPVGAEVGRVGELAAHLRDAVGAQRAVADPAAAADVGRERRGDDAHRSRSAASWTASMIFA